MFAVKCPRCGSVTKIMTDVASKKLRCPVCRAIFLAQPYPLPAEDRPGPQAGLAQAAEPTIARLPRWPLYAVIGGLVAMIVVTMCLVYVLQSRRKEADRIRAEEALATSAAPRDPKPDPKIRIAMRQKAIEDLLSGTAFFVGQLTNDHDRPLKAVTITLYAYNQAGNVLVRTHAQYQYVPAKGSIPIAVETGPAAFDEIAEAFSSAAGHLADENTACWAIPASACLRQQEEGLVVLTGKTTNKTNHNLKDVRIHCDFYDERGEYLGWTTGFLDGRKTMAADETTKFTVKLTSRRAHDVADHAARVVATRTETTPRAHVRPTP